MYSPPRARTPVHRQPMLRHKMSRQCYCNRGRLAEDDSYYCSADCAFRDAARALEASQSHYRETVAAERSRLSPEGSPRARAYARVRPVPLEFPHVPIPILELPAGPSSAWSSDDEDEVQARASDARKSYSPFGSLRKIFRPLQPARPSLGRQTPVHKSISQVFHHRPISPQADQRLVFFSRPRGGSSAHSGSDTASIASSGTAVSATSFSAKSPLSPAPAGDVQNKLLANRTRRPTNGMSPLPIGPTRGDGAGVRVRNKELRRSQSLAGLRLVPVRGSRHEDAEWSAVVHSTRGVF